MAVGSPSDEKTIRQLAAEVVSESSELMRKEVALARLEIVEAARGLRTSVAAMALGGAIALAGLFLVLLAAALGLNVWIGRLWLSVLIIGVIALAVGGATAAGARRATHAQTMVPERALQSLHEDSELLRRRIGA